MSGRDRARARTVVFDCDSTLVAIEGITQLATGHRQEVSRLTTAAMSGQVPLEDVYGWRLAVVNPTRRRVLSLGRAYLRALVPDAKEVVNALRDAGIDVRIVSAGLLPAVQCLAQALGIEPERVAAVDIRFDEHGKYMGFDEASPLVRSGGKRTVIEQWQPELKRPIWLVGDGASDVEARPVVDAFIAYTGVIRHEAAVAGADITVSSRSLAPILALVLGDDVPAGAVAREVYERGVQQLNDPTPTHRARNNRE